MSLNAVMRESIAVVVAVRAEVAPLETATVAPDALIGTDGAGAPVADADIAGEAATEPPGATLPAPVDTAAEVEAFIVFDAGAG